MSAIKKSNGGVGVSEFRPAREVSVQQQKLRNQMIQKSPVFAFLKSSVGGNVGWHVHGYTLVNCINISRAATYCFTAHSINLCNRQLRSPVSTTCIAGSRNTEPMAGIRSAKISASLTLSHPLRDCSDDSGVSTALTTKPFCLCRLGTFLADVPID